MINDTHRQVAEQFRRFAHGTASAVGAPASFLVALGVVAVWLCTGPLFGFSDTWQLVINTGTTIVTFLMVFLIQNSQNRDARAIHLKLDELLHGVVGARTALVNLESLPDEKLVALQQEFERLQTDYGVGGAHAEHLERELELRADAALRPARPTSETAAPDRRSARE